MLHSLINEDFSQITTKHTVASEESIHLLIDYFKKDEQLINPELIHADNVVTFLKSKYHEGHFGRYQLIVEFGRRALAKQGDPDKVHYCATDVYIQAEGFIVFVADHYHGRNYNSYRDVYEKLDLPIKFIVAGGTLYQADDVHCPFFTFQHLLMTAYDQELTHQLYSLASFHSGKYIQLPWHLLPPRYNFYTQSFSLISKYVEEQKILEGTSSELSCEVLAAASFDTKMSSTLISNETGKIINRAIEALVIQYSQIVKGAVSEYREDELIKIAYERYPKVLSILEKAHLNIEKLRTEGKIINQHPIFNFVFSNMPFIYALETKPLRKLKGKDPHEHLFLIYKNPIVLNLMLEGHLCPAAMFAQFTSSDGKQLTLLREPLKIAYENITALLDEAYQYYQEHGSVEFSFMELIFMKNAPRVCASPQVKELYFSGQVSPAYLGYVRPHSLSINESLSTEEYKVELDKHVTQTSPFSVSELCFTPSKGSVTENRFGFFSLSQSSHTLKDQGKVKSNPEFSSGLKLTFGGQNNES